MGKIVLEIKISFIPGFTVAPSNEDKIKSL